MQIVMKNINQADNSDNLNPQKSQTGDRHINGIQGQSPKVKTRFRVADLPPKLQLCRAITSDSSELHEAILSSNSLMRLVAHFYLSNGEEFFTKEEQKDFACGLFNLSQKTCRNLTAKEDALENSVAKSFDAIAPMS
jgi:hypothetical protein